MYDITLQEIEYFLVAAERLNFTEAAQALFASQPVISKSIKRLENEIGMKLFNRDNRGVSLTDEGELLYNKWRFMMNDFNAAVKSAQSLMDETRKSVHIGCLSEFEHDLNIKEFIRYFEEKNPDITISFELYGFKELREQLLSGACDLIISYNGELEDMKDLQQKNLTQVKQFIAISSKHRLADKEDLALHHLKNETFYILNPAESKKSVNRLIEALSSIDFNPRRIEYSPNISSLAFAVSQGRGITISHKLITRGYENDIRLIPFTELFNNIYLAVAWRKDGITPELRKMIDLI
ncbi:transcriptional regulator, LysR family [Sporobacter termitidis DSM 10068]|uniref:Transcriptional regulator, LysR family n=1 Tax=Sporobacter termitidis DSM 10068 TaxID=1123282 RepID=A0A1M5XKF0_9FIRM|nr:LysR family transcriptional regulator [Sporobacter termitidis]SHI00112.1 transcriptional regulator, LysR family [Sporobacter termitidis DSM 10068]